MFMIFTVSTIENISEVVVVEQFINTLPDNIHVWIKERKPITSLEAGQLASIRLSLSPRY